MLSAEQIDLREHQGVRLMSPEHAEATHPGNRYRTETHRP
jgi:hypothetical protein